jgi:hypothetical protein
MSEAESRQLRPGDRLYSTLEAGRIHYGRVLAVDDEGVTIEWPLGMGPVGCRTT